MFKSLKKLFYNLVFKISFPKGFIFNKKFKYKIPVNDYNFKKFNALYFQGHLLIDDKIKIDGDVYSIKNLDVLDDDYIQKKLLSFDFIQGLRVLNTNESKDKALEVVGKLISHCQNYSNEYWNLGLVSKRISNLLLCIEFLGLKESSQQKLNDFLNQNISFLLFSYNKYPVENKLDIVKALILISIYIEEVDYIKTSINFLKKDIQNNILDDGGYRSRNNVESLEYLESLIIIYHFLSLSKQADIGFIRSTMDKISTFIRSVRGIEGDLAIFNGSYPVDKLKIDYVLSLGNIDTSPSYYLRDSGYYKFNNDNFDVTFDIGKQDVKYNSLLSFELGIHKNKIITNIPSNNFYKNQDGRLNHSCLIIYLDDQPLFFQVKNKNIQERKRCEDNWEIVQFTYHHKEYIEFIYYKTLYFSKNTKTCYILGEDLISMQSGLKKIKKAFLRFYLSPNIKSLEVMKKKSIASFSIGDENFIFSSNNNKMRVSKTYFQLDDKFSEFVYCFDIDFNMSNSIIKNEWFISNMQSF